MSVGIAQYIASLQPGQNGFGGGSNIAQEGDNSIGNLLQNSSGLSAAGTLTSALQTGAGFNALAGIANPNSVLAAAINPNVNLSPSTNLQVTDFVNAAQDAFPNAAPAAPAADNTQPTTDNSTSSSSASSSASQPSAPAPVVQDSTSPTGIYNAVASANASTVRGTSVNTVA